ncbi:hypothetical protein ACYULU_01045 [Breznakiellaceae bacterium SP9]
MKAMHTHTTLFLYELGNVYRYKVSEISGGAPQYELLRYADDEKCRKFSDDFWERWKNDAGYTDDDAIDFAILSDDERFHLDIPTEFQPRNPTAFFSRDRVRMFIEQELNYNNVVLSYLDREEQIKNKRDMVNDKQKKVFLTIPYPAQEAIKPPASGNYDLGAHILDIKNSWPKA